MRPAVSANKIAAYQSGATASVQRLAQLLPSQMSEPWHVSKPARQIGCRLRKCAGLADGRRGDQRGQRTVGSVAFTVCSSRPGAERLGLPNASPYSAHESNPEKRERQETQDRESHRNKRNCAPPTTQDFCKVCHSCEHHAAPKERVQVSRPRFSRLQKSRPLLRRPWPKHATLSMSNRHRYTHYAERTKYLARMWTFFDLYVFVRLRAVCLDRRAGVQLRQLHRRHCG